MSFSQNSLHTWLRRLFNAAACGAIATTVGCGGGPSAVPKPSFDPSDVSEQAMQLYDADGDGFIAGAELEKVPCLKDSLKAVDADGDGKVSAEEIAERVRTWEKQSIGLTSFECRVTLDGQPLADAEVILEPEPFLGGVVQEARGTTMLTGVALPTVPKDKRPSADSPPGVQAGYYKVRVSKKVNGSEMIPARFNSETTLGQEIAKDDPRIQNKSVIYELKKK
ncbi:MAG: EF-hand domain-containing protein [Planctomycetales bacterium]|nr:EF-hand domain-containing protein [Planctomycetales bacterium]